MAALILTAPCWPADEPKSNAPLVLHLTGGPTGNHLFYHRLLQESLRATGHAVRIESYPDLPQTRILTYLSSDKLTLHWMLQTPERDAQFVRVDFPLTQGLIGQRVLLVPRGEESAYANVKTLAQFRALGKVAGLGKGWFDVAVWRANELPYMEQGGDWRQLFNMVAARDRGVDYFPRGANEIMAEAVLHSDLTVEPNLLLIYQRDFYFYLSKRNAALKPLIEAALKHAERSGLQKKLLDEHFGSSVEQLGMDKRVRIPLATP